MDTSAIKLDSHKLCPPHHSKTTVSLKAKRKALETSGDVFQLPTTICMCSKHNKPLPPSERYDQRFGTRIFSAPNSVPQAFLPIASAYAHTFLALSHPQSSPQHVDEPCLLPACKPWQCAWNAAYQSSADSCGSSLGYPELWLSPIKMTRISTELII